MRHATKDVIITLTIDMVLTPLIGIGNSEYVSLEIIVMNVTTISWDPMTCFALVLYQSAYM